MCVVGIPGKMNCSNFTCQIHPRCHVTMGKKKRKFEASSYSSLEHARVAAIAFHAALTGMKTKLGGRAGQDGVCFVFRVDRGLVSPVDASISSMQCILSSTARALGVGPIMPVFKTNPGGKEGLDFWTWTCIEGAVPRWPRRITGCHGVLRPDTHPGLLFPGHVCTVNI